MKLSLVIPVRDEAEVISDTIVELARCLDDAEIAHEILVVDDGSTDQTTFVVGELSQRFEGLRWIANPYPSGYGNAVRAGLKSYAGDAVCVIMADGSDDPGDVVRYYRKLEEGYGCVFGSRFMEGARVVDYPWPKLVLNRLVNHCISGLFGLGYTDVTNAFKCFRRETIDGLAPIISRHFNLTVELPLKAIVRGYSWTVVPTNWFGRPAGSSKFLIKEMGSRYLFTVLYVLMEKCLARSDYARQSEHGARGSQSAPARRSVSPPR